MRKKKKKHPIYLSQKNNKIKRLTFPFRKVEAKEKLAVYLNNLRILIKTVLYSCLQLTILYSRSTPVRAYLLPYNLSLLNHLT